MNSKKEEIVFFILLITGSEMTFASEYQNHQNCPTVKRREVYRARGGSVGSCSFHNR